MEGDHHPEAAAISWWDPVYPIAQLETEWNKSLAPWLDYIRTHTEVELKREIVFINK